jgi:uncharacterized protein (TIGR00288 family)
MQLAVFIDFDNIEIGVKTTLNNELDISLVLDALKERGDVVSKSAYGDWARSGMHSRSMTEHAVHMVQRNVTPRGDKNGADINLVVDAMEMCFTRSHIDGFAIVGGDSDFIALVEKLKQFGKRVYVVGGRSFTSGILQRNCHEFIAYENLLGGRSRGGDRQHSRGGSSASSGRLSIEQGFAQVQRALKILADRGVEPQLGPLKSTLLQLDSTFSERDYGTSSFREFIQKLADKHHLSLRRIDNGYVVELNGDGPRAQARPETGDESGAEPIANGDGEAAAQAAGARADAPSPAGVKSSDEALALLRTALEKLGEQRSGKPLYVRHLAQGLRAVDPDFDETAYGFRTLTELMHLGQREGLLRMQRDRQGAWRVTPTTGEGGAATAEAGEGASAPAETGWTASAVARYAGDVDGSGESDASRSDERTGEVEVSAAPIGDDRDTDVPAAVMAAAEPADESAAEAGDEAAETDDGAADTAPAPKRRRSSGASRSRATAPRAKTTPRASKPRASGGRKKAKDASEASE